mgnify:CR=1 FL=1
MKTANILTAIGTKLGFGKAASKKAETMSDIENTVQKDINTQSQIRNNAATGAGITTFLKAGAAVALFGIGIGVAAMGMADLISAFETAGWKELSMAGVTLAAVAAGAFFMAKGVAALGASGKVATVGLLTVAGSIALIGAGIGLFLAIIGLQIMEVVVDNPVTLVQLGDLSNPLVLLGCATFIAIIVLDKMNIKGNIIIGILLFSIIAWATGLAKFNGIASSPPPMTYLFEFDLSAAMTAGMSTVIFTLLFIDFFDTAGTLTSVANVAGKVGKDGKVQDINKAMLSDSVGTVAGSLMGTTTVTSYVESGAGVKAGGRTGMTSLVIGVLFLACLFFSPLATSLPKEIDGAALLYVAVLFVRNITDIDWDDIAESAPAVVAFISMPLTYSISHGIALSFIAYALIKIFTGKFNTTSPAIWLIAILSVASFVVA